MIKFLKQKFGRQNVKKVIYFSDGAGSQYKNKSNFLNLLLHKKDFSVEAEWHFFATSHGKGACDGIGGCVKRNAYRACLQDNTIVTVPKLYEWARSFFKKIDFDFCLLNECENHQKNLKSRFAKAKTVVGTRRFHCYKPYNANSLECKIFSSRRRHTRSSTVSWARRCV